MKISILNTPAFQKGDVLTRAQLKNVLGGLKGPDVPEIGTGSGLECGNECDEDRKCMEGKTCTLVDDRQECGSFAYYCL